MTWRPGATRVLAQSALCVIVGAVILASTTRATAQAQPRAQLQSQSQPQPQSSSQPKTTTTRSSPSSQDVPRPPVMQFPGGGIGLKEAVQLTLLHDPALKIQEAAVRFQEGVALEQEGAFDYNIFGNLFYEYRQQELPESRKEIERDKRTRIQEGLDQNRENFQRAQTLSQRLQEVRNASDRAKLDEIASIDPEVGAQLQILDVLINNQANPAIRNELDTVRRTFIDRTVNDLQANAAEIASQFEGAERRLRDLGIAPSDEVIYNGGFELRVSKRLRNGLLFTPFVDGRAEGTNFKDKPRSADFGGKGLADLYTLRIGLDTVVPLGRGRGGDATAAFERSANAEAEAARLTAEHQSALSVLRTTTAYWDLKAAEASLDVATQSVTLQARILELTRASIDAGELPRVDLARVQASDARARARLREAERVAHDARIVLAQAMGLAVEGQATLPGARDDFPAAPAATAVTADEVARLATEAAQRRADVRSAERLEESGRALARGAQTDLRPRLDVVNSTWATALDEGSVREAIDRWVGPSTELRLEVEQPLFNNAAEGRYAQRRAEHQQRQIATFDTRRQVGLGVVRAAQAVQQARARVDHAQAAVDAYQTTTDGEIERFKGGDVTLIDTILTEQQQTDARLALIAARQDLARLIAELRFETGTLVRFDKAKAVVEATDLVTVPTSGRPR